MKIYFLLVVFIITIACGLPVIEKESPKQPETHNERTEGEDWELNLEYGRYLKEVVQALESDADFRKKLETANVDDIKSGKIARELPFVDHNVRTKLDELKRRELERLRHLAMQEHQKTSGGDRAKLKIPVHVDHRNPTKFESEDLRKLISQLNVDLEDLDKKRQQEFKTYEMDKEFEYQQEVNHIQDETKRAEVQKKHQAEEKKHQDHPKLHHPGSKQQLEEVWEEQDHMSPEDFDPTTFFHLHDLDGNGFWDETEVKALFQKELNKMYDQRNPEDDLQERYEEMERMREHVFNETDTNGDKLISFEEFLEQTKRNEFEQDPGWQGLDEQEVYSQGEYEEFTRRRQDEIQRLIDSGALPPGSDKLPGEQQVPAAIQQGINTQQQPPQQPPQLINKQPPQQINQQPPQQINQQPPQQINQQPQQNVPQQVNQVQQRQPPSLQQVGQKDLGSVPVKPIENNHIK